MSLRTPGGKEQGVSDSPNTVEQVNIKKVVIPFEQEGPVEEPLFVNMGQVAFHDEIVYIDVGVLPIDEVLTKDAQRELRFLLLSRLVMSVPTLKNLQGQIEQLLAGIKNRETSS